MGDITFDPMDAEFIANPYPTYHRLRAEEPVHHNPLGFWVLTRYEDVLMVLRDPQGYRWNVIHAVRVDVA